MQARACVACCVLLACAPEARAWPADLMRSMLRDARRVLPPSLNRLIGEREELVLAELSQFPPDLAQTLAADLADGKLSQEGLAALEAFVGEAPALLRQKRVSEGLVRLAATLRIPADLSDPVLSVGPAGYPPGVTREYYAFVAANLGKLPVVLEDRDALVLQRSQLAAYWQSVLSRSREKSHVIRAELFQANRVVDHRTLDYRNPVFGVAQISYSRAVTSIAATWLALWREANGDLREMPKPKQLHPGAGGPPR
jgi:hypothetical protein